MNTNQIAQIATSLNVSPNQIKRAEEWANVLFVVVAGKGSRFVSKKVLKMQTKLSLDELKKARNAARKAQFAYEDSLGCLANWTDEQRHEQRRLNDVLMNIIRQIDRLENPDKDLLAGNPYRDYTIEQLSALH